MANEYLTVAQAREELGVSKVKMSQWVKDGVILVVQSPYDKRLKLVHRSDVERLRAMPRLPKKVAPAA